MSKIIWTVTINKNIFLTSFCVVHLGENFAVFRSSDGNVNILNAYCPHLGANMAIGGTVKGNGLQCPFHGWVFDGTSGSCVHIPSDCSKGKK